MKNEIPTVCALGSILSLLLLCSCATRPHPRATGWPVEVSFNQEAGRGGLVIVMVRLDGKALPCIVDTGSISSCLDTSMEPKLGPLVGTETVNQWGKLSRKNAYAMPKLYLGGVQLQAGNRMMTTNLKQLPFLSDRPVMGMLGMDVLQHYCLQFDFAAGKLRLLDGERTDKSTWGRMFPIVALNARDARPAVAGNLLGAEGPHSLIDSGFDGDGWLMPQYFQQWTNAAVAPVNGAARQPDARFFGENYPQATLHEKDVESDGIGLAFLARHLVTLDFPRHALYLKRTSTGPLPNFGVAGAINFLKDLKDQGQMPGWSRADQGKPKNITADYAKRTITVATTKDGDSSTYHYIVRRAAKGPAWKLVRAWRTDQNGKTIGKFSVP